MIIESVRGLLAGFADLVEGSGDQPVVRVLPAAAWSFLKPTQPRQTR
jgi:hypothetical protein